MRRAFQSPYGGRGRSDLKEAKELRKEAEEFQSPYGGRGRSEDEVKPGEVILTSFNHLTVA